MRRKFGPTSGIAWAIVALVGLGVIGIVLGMGLFGRLNSGQKVLASWRPAFTNERIAGAAAGIGAISIAVNAADPIVTDKGGGAAEVPKLIAFVSQKTGLAPAQVVGALQGKFPHLTALLQAIPLSGVTSELPAVVKLLSTVLKLSPAQVTAALQGSFPHLAQAITSLPTVTGGWDAVPGLGGLTRFDGSQVSSVVDIRNYFQGDVIPAMAAEKTDFQNLDTFPPPVDSFPPLLLVVGILATLLGAVMAWRGFRGKMKHVEGAIAWLVVEIVGLVVLGVIFGFLLFPSLNGGAKLVDTLRPAFANARVQGDSPAIGMVSSVVDLLDPITTAKGGAAAEVPKLIEFVSQKTGLAPADVVAALDKAAPRTTALLEALPLSAVAAEMQRLPQFLSATLKLPVADVAKAVAQSFPRLAQSITYLPQLTAAWDNLPGAPGFTRFDGAAITNVTGVRDYFGADVVPLVAKERANFHSLDTSPALDVFPPLLLAIGLAVTLLALGMLIASQVDFDPRAASEPAPGGAPGGASA